MSASVSIRCEWLEGHVSGLEDVDMKACAGDWVEVLSKEEILRTLDKNGRLDKLPFKYCGCE